MKRRIGVKEFQIKETAHQKRAIDHPQNYTEFKICNTDTNIYLIDIREDEREVVFCDGVVTQQQFHIFLCSSASDAKKQLERIIK